MPFTHKKIFKNELVERTSVMSPLPVSSLGATGVAVTRLGLGTAGIGNLYRKVGDDDAAEALQAAFGAGIAYADTAPHYGQGLAERRLGAALRDGMMVSSKVGRVLEPIAPPPPGTERHGFVDGDPFEPVYDYSHDGVMRSFEASCARLGREHIDILLAHDLGRLTHGDDHPRHLKAFLDGGYRAMAELKAAGRISAIGLGVNEWQVAEEVLGHADLDGVLLAGRYTLLEHTALASFFPLCLKRGVSVIAGGPYNSGILIGGAHYNYEAAPAGIVARVHALQAVCDRHNVPLAAAALQFPLAHACVACVIPGMTTAAEVAANLALFDMDIPAALWDELRAEGLLDEAAPVPVREAMAS